MLDRCDAGRRAHTRPLQASRGSCENGSGDSAAHHQRQDIKSADMETRILMLLLLAIRSFKRILILKAVAALRWISCFFVAAMVTVTSRRLGATLTAGARRRRTRIPSARDQSSLHRVSRPCRRALTLAVCTTESCHVRMRGYSTDPLTDFAIRMHRTRP